MKINEKGHKLMTNVTYQIRDQLWPNNYKSACNYAAKFYHEATLSTHISFEKKNLPLLMTIARHQTNHDSLTNHSWVFNSFQLLPSSSLGKSIN